MLQAYGKTPDEWGELPRETRHFLETAWNEKREREAEAQDEIDVEGLR